MKQLYRRTERWDQIGFLLTWILVFLIPWGDMILLPMRVQGSRVFTIVAAAAWIPLLWRGRLMRPLETAHYWMLLFLLWAGINILQSTEPERTLRRVLSYSQLFMVAWIIHQTVLSAERYHKLMMAWLAGCTVCLASLLLNFARDIHQGDGRFTARGFDPNDLAVTLALGIPVAWYLSLHKPAIAWLIRLYIPAAMAGILLTASRGGSVTMCVVLLFLLSTVTRSTIKTLASVSVLLLLCAIAISKLSSDISFHRLSTIGNQVSSRDLNGRFDIWLRGYAAFEEHPLVGVGAGNFEDAVGATRGTGMAAHNAVLGVAVEHGMIGLIFFLGAIASLLRRAWRTSPLERKFWVIVLLGWSVGVMTLSWENREMTWLLWGMCAATPQLVRKRVPQFILWRPHAPAST